MILLGKTKPKSSISFLSDEFIESLEELDFVIQEGIIEKDFNSKEEIKNTSQ